MNDDASLPADLAAWVAWDHVWTTWKDSMLEAGAYHTARTGDVELMERYLQATGLPQQYADYYVAHTHGAAKTPRAVPGGAHAHDDPRPQARLPLPTMAAVYKWAQQQGITDVPANGNADLWYAIQDGATDGISFYVPQFGDTRRGGAGKLGGATPGSAAPGASPAHNVAANGGGDLIPNLAAIVFAKVKLVPQMPGPTNPIVPQVAEQLAPAPQMEPRQNHTAAAPGAHNQGADVFDPVGIARSQTFSDTHHSGTAGNALVKGIQ